MTSSASASKPPNWAHGSSGGARERERHTTFAREAGPLPELLELLEAVIDERVELALARQATPEKGAPWLTLEQAAERLGCSPDAVRMRAKRGRLELRRQGRRLYVSRASVDGLA